MRKDSSRTIGWLGALVTVFWIGSSPRYAAAAQFPTNSAVAGGGFHSVALQNDGRVWVWGSGAGRQLGNAATNHCSVPVAIPDLTNIIAIAAGESNSLVLRSDGKAFAWGDGLDGQLGNGGITNSYSPVEVTVSGFSAIAAGAYHGLALKSNGTAWAWGFNWDGELGNGVTNSSAVPVQALGLTNVTKIAAGAFHCLAISNGNVWAWGWNEWGQLGDGSYNNRLTPVRVSGLSNIVAIAGGYYHSLAVDSSGRAWAWGDNFVGQLGDGTTVESSVPILVPSLSNVTSVAAGTWHSVFLRTDGTIWTSGFNADGQLGTAVTNDSLVPAQVFRFKNAHSIAAGQYHSMAICTNDTVWSWGYNGNGLLGDDTTINQFAPVPVDGLTIRDPYSPHPLARSARFRRGHGVTVDFYSFVIPLDGQKGVKLNPAGGNVDILFKTNCWSKLLGHYNRENPSIPLSFKNPIAGFGSRVGGTPLYFGQDYNFGIYGGDPAPKYTNAIVIEVYDKTMLTNVATVYLTVPTPSQTNDWANFLTNGYTRTTNVYGLTTTLSFISSLVLWGTDSNGCYHLTHRATESNYLYVVGIRGQVHTNLMVQHTNAHWWSPLYTLDFETRPAWRAVFVNQPHFEGQPLPPAYQGKSLQELMTISATVTNSVSVSPSACTTLDNSPELRQHPILDAFVEEVGRDPLLLANYVFNEIELTDAIAYNDYGDVSERSVNLGGVNRGALATFLEGQGSPLEQCALLVYLMRRAGVPATYVFPPHNGLQMLDLRMSKLLRMQLRGLVNNLGESNVPELFSVNYPWVAIYISTNGTTTNWVHLFPWLKDTEIVEGQNLYQYMPTNYDNAFKWVKQYFLGDTNILATGVANTPASLFPRFIQERLQTNGLSLADVGVRMFDRKHFYSGWPEFPRPTLVTNTSISVESLTASGITNVSPSMTNIFDTVSAEVWSVDDPTNKISTGEMRMVDLHNRRFLLRHEKVAGSSPVKHRMILSLAPYRAETTNNVSFGSAQAMNATNTTVLNRLVTTNILKSTDDDLTLKVVHKRHRALSPDVFETNAHWKAFLGVEAPSVITEERPLRKGDLATICLSVGRVTPKMLFVHAQEIWEMHRAVQKDRTKTNAYSPDVYQGTIPYLMGMSYYHRVSFFQTANEQYHKARNVSYYAVGLAKVSPKRDSNGNLPSGNIDLVYPNVDMFYQQAAVAGNGTLRPDQGDDFLSAAKNYFYVFAADASAEEHETLNVFYGQKKSVSTIQLLQNAQAAGAPGVLMLTKHNYKSMGTNKYPAGGTMLKDHDPTIWKTITNTFETSPASNFVQVAMTPGKLTNDTGTYQGVGALIFDDLGSTALIGNNANGAWIHVPLPDGSSAEVFIPNWILQLLAGQRPVSDPNGNEVSDLSKVTLASFLVAWNPPPTPGVPDPVNTLPPDTVTRDQEANVTTRGQNGNYVPPPPVIDWAQLQRDLLRHAPQGNVSQNHGQAVAIAKNSGFSGTPTPAGRGVGTMIADPVNAVTGEFYVDATDLRLEGPMPLEVRRNYLSQNLSENHFGWGWKLGLNHFLAVSSDTNVITATEPDGALIVYVQNTNDVNLWTPTFAGNPTLNNYTTLGVGSTANAFQGRLRRETAGTNTFYKLSGADGSVRTFQQKSFVNLTTNSRPFLIRWEDASSNYLTFYYGTNALHTDFGELCRVESPNGDFIGFGYDHARHIIEAFSSDGKRVNYGYNDSGDLVSVTLPDGSRWGFEYRRDSLSITNGANVTNHVYSTHLLTREVKPAGRLLVNEYDAERRVTNQLATVGTNLVPVRNATFTYANNFRLTNSASTNTVTGHTLVLDVFGRTNRFDYTNGLITTNIDALSQITRQEWYFPGNTNSGAYPRSLKARTDPRGLRTEYVYDAFGNVLTNIVSGSDLTGDGQTNAVYSFSYDTNRMLLTSATDPASNKVELKYSTNYPYLPERTAFFAGQTAVATNLAEYYNVTSVITRSGVQVTNTMFGLLRRFTRAHGSSDAAVAEWLHDNRGFPRERVLFTGTSDPAVTNYFVFGRRGELLERKDSDGRAARFRHDGRDNQTAIEVFEAGAATPSFWEYSYFNENGELVWSDGPRYDPEDYVWHDFDGAGRLKTQIHWRSRAKQDGSGVEAETGDVLHATTFYEHDAFGNLMRIIGPRGSVTTNLYDAVGQLLATKTREPDGTLLAQGDFTYEPGGRMASQVNALGGVTERQYTTGGVLKRQQNPDGSTNGWTYYLDGRLRVAFLSNGSYWTNSYEDSARRLTRAFRSASGTLLATNIFEFDRRGNLTRRVDALGNVFTNSFDALDRIKVNSGPLILFEPPPDVPLFPGMTTNKLQLAQTYSYDASGRVLTSSNALGERTVALFDVLGRATSLALYGSNGTLIRTSATVFAANHHSFATWTGSGSAAIPALTFTDNDGQPVLSLRYPNYPSLSPVEFDWRAHDVAGNPVASRECSWDAGQLTIWATNGWTFDGLNRVRTSTTRDGATAIRSYDLAGNVTNLALPGGGLEWRALYDNATRMTASWNAGGGSSAHSNSYTYYAGGHRWAGLPQTRIDGRSVSCTYSYDDWLRLATNAHEGPLNEQDLTTTWLYDSRGWLTNISESFSSSNTGPATSVRRLLDAYGLAHAEYVRTNGIAVWSSSQDWDSGPRRTSLQLGAFRYAFGWRADGLLTSSQGETGGGSYSYNDAGQLISRTVGSRITTVTQRDRTGRPLALSTTLVGTPKLTEALAYRSDGLLSSHTVSRTNTTDSFTDQRAYLYADASRRLIEERLNLDATKRWTNTFAYDNGQAGGIGVLTKSAQAGGLSQTWRGVPDALARVATETNGVVRRLAWGKINGPSTVTAKLDGAPQPLTVLTTGDTNWSHQWRATVELTPGAHQLQALATHSSGLFTTNATIWFTNGATGDPVTVSFDGGGYVTNRVWRDASNNVIRTQSLVWDARGRLVKVTERDLQTNGFNWSALYDPLGRRLRTSTITVTNGSNLTAQATTITSFYDPEVEFLELGVSVNGATTWKLYGPDADGVYGGLNGTGGFDAIVPGPHLFCPVLSDARGNVHAVYDQDHGNLMWNDSRPTGYGAAPGWRPPPLGFGANIIQAAAWRGRWSDPHGNYWLGGNYYDSTAGHFLRPDAYGHFGSPSQFEFCHSDPINYWDPDGRLGSRSGIRGSDLAAMNQARIASGMMPLTREGGVPCAVCHGRNAQGHIPGVPRTYNFVNGQVRFSGDNGHIIGNYSAGFAGQAAAMPQQVGNFLIHMVNYFVEGPDAPMVDHLNAEGTRRAVQKAVYGNVEPNSLLTTSGEFGAEAAVVMVPLARVRAAATGVRIAGGVRGSRGTSYFGGFDPKTGKVHLGSDGHFGGMQAAGGTPMPAVTPGITVLETPTTVIWANDSISLGKALTSAQAAQVQAALQAQFPRKIVLQVPVVK